MLFECSTLQDKGHSAIQCDTLQDKIGSQCGTMIFSLCNAILVWCMPDWWISPLENIVELNEAAEIFFFLSLSLNIELPNGVETWQKLWMISNDSD